MTSDRIDVVSDGYEGWNRRDFDAMVRRLAPDVVLRTAGVFPGLKPVYHGHDGVRRFWNAMQEAWELIEIRPERFVEHDDKVLAVVEVAGYRETEEALAAEDIPSAALGGAPRIAR